MTNRKFRPNGHRRRLSPRTFLALSLCLAIGLLQIGTETSLAISGFSTDGPAVSAQYPDAAGSPAEAPAIGTLQDIADVTSAGAETRDPTVLARRREAAQVINRRATAALSSNVGMSPPESGLFALLYIAGIAVAAMASLLRWRRGLST
jgi:hypothetical protein